MATIDANISDGWEKVDEDDNLSIISLPDSEDGTADLSRGLQAMAVQAPKHAVHASAESPSESPSESPTPVDIRPDVQVIVRPLAEQAVERCGMDTVDVVEPDTLQVPSEDLITKESDFRDLLTMTVSMKNIMTALLKLPPHRFDQKAKPFVETACRHLIFLERLLELAKPSTLGVGDKTFGIQFPGGFTHRLKWLHVEALSIKKHWENLDFIERRNRLKRFSGLLDIFMNNIQRGYQRFITSHVADHTMPDKDTTAHVRRELHVLEDRITALLAEIRSCEQDAGIDNSRGQLKKTLTLSLGYKKTKDSLGTILAYFQSHCTHSELKSWIKHSMVSKLTYAEFCHLDIDAIRSVSLQLSEATEQLYVERRRVQTLRYTNDPDGVLQGEKMIISDSTLRRLVEAKVLLTSLLRLRKSA
ncbi:hypothetical protein F5Y01DRAFT_45553 [Xylaria sp. FL0043]|nr:hypothetical protein F5Y01DRAFT_45553 [Xylaria sp. FL0043]